MPHNENGLSETSCQTWKLICINAVTAGLEVVSSVVFTIVPPLLLKLGYSETQMSLLFGVGKNIVTSDISQNLEIKLVRIVFKLVKTLTLLGPLLCLIFVPILGTWSDKCISPFGRRRPFIFVYSLCIILTMVLLSTSEWLVNQGDTKYLG